MASKSADMGAKWGGRQTRLFFETSQPKGSQKEAKEKPKGSQAEKG